VRLLVLGSSSSVGSGLARRDLAWPWLVARELPGSIDEPVDLAHEVIFPVGPAAVPRAKAAVERFHPDVVIYAYGAYPCAVETVALRVKQLLGERAFRMFRRAERRFDSTVGGSAAKRRRSGRWVRWLARRTIGVAPLTTFEELSGIQLEIVHWLSRFEGMVVIVSCEPDLPAGPDEVNTRANIILARDRDLVNGVAIGHHFLISDCRPGFAAVPDRDRLFQADAVHKTEAGHAIQAQSFLQTLLSAPSPYADRVVRPA
jgi:hypothetical protein